jgi:hypothetical protein
VVPGTATQKVATENPNCKLFYGNHSFANWATFADANPTLITTPGAIPFIIADGIAGTDAVSDIVLR